MTAQTLTCVILVCDGCGRKQDQDGMVPHYDTAEQARNPYRETDGNWWSNGTVDLCSESCIYDPHPAVLDEYGWCGRCGDLPEHDDERHGPEYPVVPAKTKRTEGAAR
jgi:hypothetical protein